MSRLLQLLILLLALAPWPATAERLRSTTDLRVSDDSDDVSQTRFSTGLMRRVGESGRHRGGVAVGYDRLSEPDDSYTFRRARLDYEGRFGARTGADVSVAALASDDWSPIVGSAVVRHDFAGPVYVEASAGRSYVDTIAAIEREIDIDSASLSIDLGAFAGWTLVGAHTEQSFGDGNNRGVTVGRAIYDVPQWAPLLIEGRARALRTDFDAPEYFSPERVDEYLGIVTWRQAVLDDRWFVSLKIGAGRQSINREAGENIYLAEAEWRGWFSDHWGLEARAGCRNTGDLRASGADDYRFCQGRIALLRSW
ncbi:MAG: hypothetical protein ACOCP9_04020 [Halofilum sp. (in: g-proteobacteria)]